MTILRTCAGCIYADGPCVKRQEMKRAIHGLGITSIKFKCVARLPLYQVGQSVWASLAVSLQDDEGSRYYASFPGTVVENLKGEPTKVLVYVHEGVKDAAGRYEFQPNSTGFCKLSISRVQASIAPPEPICSTCQRPIKYGHADYCEHGDGATFSDYEAAILAEVGMPWNQP